MSTSNSGLGCKKICWLVAAAAGLFVFVVSMIASSNSLLTIILISVAVFIVLGLLLSYLLCSEEAVATAVPEEAAPPQETPAPQPAPVAAAPSPATASEEATGQPASLDAPRESGADDLKQIKGVGPKLEKLLNSMGYFHFDQLASWTDEDVAWADQNLAGFKGRVSRDEWVKQAKVLASGGETEFSKRVEGGDVY